MDVNVWMEKAKQMITKRRTGSKFTLRQLFEDTGWTELSAGERRRFGKYFKKEVDLNHVKGIPASDSKTSANAIEYTKEE